MFSTSLSHNLFEIYSIGRPLGVTDPLTLDGFLILFLYNSEKNSNFVAIMKKAVNLKIRFMNREQAENMSSYVHADDMTQVAIDIWCSYDDKVHNMYLWELDRKGTFDLEKQNIIINVIFDSSLDDMVNDGNCALYGHSIRLLTEYLEDEPNTDLWHICEFVCEMSGASFEGGGKLY